jgi:ABC-2 type transport system ATP-binding protein
MDINAGRNAEPVVTVESCHKRYGDVVAVDDVSFPVRRGEIFGLLGPNGAGKTSLVECMQGLRSRDGGSIRVLGIDPERRPDQLRRRIGSQLQSSGLPARLRVGEAISLFAANHRDRPRPKLAEVLAAWDLTELRNRPFAALSGGQRQRLFLALALLGRPDVVFLDELTTGLDPQARRDTWALVRGVRDRGATVVLVTHLMEEAEALCDRVAIVDRGRLVALGSPAGLTAAEVGGVRLTFTIGDRDAGFLAGLEEVASLSVTGGIASVSGDGSAAVAVAAALAERGLRPTDFRTHHPTLETVFLHLTGRRFGLTPTEEITP